MTSDMPVAQELAQPVTASVSRRVVSWSIDYTIVMVPAVALVTLALVNLAQGLPGYVGGVAGTVGWSRMVHLFTDRGSGHGLGAAALSEWIPFAAPLIGALLLVPIIQFLYQAVLLGWRGRTVGMMAADIRAGARGSGAVRLVRGQARRRALTTTVLETGVVSVAFVLVAIGQLTIGLFLWGIAIAAFWLNAFAALGPRHRTIVDRLTGTVVVRRSLYSDVARRSLEMARKTSEAAITAGQRTTQAAVTAGQITSDAAAVAAQLTRERTEIILQSAPVQQAQALGVAGAERARDLSVAGAERARELSGQAAGQVRKFGGRAQQMWQERRAKREQPSQEDGDRPHM